jgi:hypothetical protein
MTHAPSSCHVTHFSMRLTGFERKRVSGSFLNFSQAILQIRRLCSQKGQKSYMNGPQCYRYIYFLCFCVPSISRNSYPTKVLQDTNGLVSHRPIFQRVHSRDSSIPCMSSHAPRFSTQQFRSSFSCGKCLKNTIPEFESRKGTKKTGCDCHCVNTAGVFGPDLGGYPLRGITWIPSVPSVNFHEQIIKICHDKFLVTYTVSVSPFTVIRSTSEQCNLHNWHSIGKYTHLLFLINKITYGMTIVCDTRCMRRCGFWLYSSVQDTG